MKKNTKTHLWLCVMLSFLIASKLCFSQNVGINGTGAAPNSSAMLDIDATNKGFLMPRLSTAQRDSIVSPAQALQIFNTTTKCIEVYYGPVWQTASCFCNAAASTPGTITGSATACTGSSQTYSIASVANATSYAWTVPSGAGITGQGTTSVVVTFSGSSGNVSVSASNACGNSAANNLAVTVSSPTITSTTPASRCDAGTVALGATASTGTINWYATASGGSALATGASYTTPSLSSTTTYYVDATSNGCTTSTRTGVTATINTTPTITGTTPGSRVGPGTVTLGATASAGTINWYAAASGGSSLGTGTSFTTPSISTTTNYYVDATANGCTTATRTSVTASVPSVIARDAFTVGQTNGNFANSTSWNHTCSGTNRLLVVWTEGQGTSAATSVSYNGTALTQIQGNLNGGNSDQSNMWYLVNPDSGTHSISISRGSGGYWFGGIGQSYTGVNQSTPLNASASGSGSGTSGAGTLTTTVNNCFAIMSTIPNGSFPTISASTNSTFISGVMDWTNAFDTNAHGAITPAGSFSMNFSLSSSASYLWEMAAFAPAP